MQRFSCHVPGSIRLSDGDKRQYLKRQLMIAISDTSQRSYKRQSNFPFSERDKLVTDI